MSRAEAALHFAIFLDLVGFGMAFPDIQLRAEAFGAPGWLIGVLLSSYFLVQLVASPRWGVLSDRIGRKPVLLVCTFLSAVSMVVYAYADNVWIILASRILAGLAAANVVVAQAYIADNTSEEQRGGAMGRVSAAILAGLVIGPAVGGWLAEVGGNRLMGLAAASASGLSFLWMALTVQFQPKVAARQPGSRAILDLRLLRDFPGLRRIVIVAATGWFVLACLEGTFGRLIERQFGYGQWEFGLVFSYESLLGAFFGVAIAWLSKRLSSGAMLRLGYLGQGIGVGLMPLAPLVASAFLASPVDGVTGALGAMGLHLEPKAGLMALMLGGTLFAFGTGIANPTINAVCSAIAPPERQGELFGLLQAARSAGFLVGPAIGGLLFDWRPEAPYALASATGFLAALLIGRPEVRCVGEPRAPA